MRKMNELCFYCVIAMFLLSLVMLACSTKSPVEPTTVICSKDFDASGGELTCGGATIVVAPGALDSVLTVKITQILKPANPPSNYSFPEPGYIIEPHDYLFKDSIAIRINYTNDAAVHTLFYQEDNTDTLWETVSDVTYNSGVATIATDHLSVFAIGRFSPLTAVYVSTSSRGITAAGTKKDPLPSVNLGIIAAHDAGTPHPTVYVAEGTYQEDVTFLDSISVRGGYNPVTWVKNGGAYSTIELKTTAALASNISSPTTISALKIIAAYPLEPSNNSIALWANSCTGNLVLDSCWIEAGAGANGTSGGDGGYGAVGSNGGGGSGSSGGRGGDGCFPGGSGGYSTNGGASGGGPNGGGGGSWGLAGSDGGRGGSGLYGQNGSGGVLGSIIFGSWVPGNGPSGKLGACGSGGGGGGGGYFVFVPSGGGGGGGGGYGGGFGVGGRGAGASFAVFLVESSPIFQDCTLKSGNGGKGGNGGNGNKGGAGGGGGRGYNAGVSSGGSGGNGGTGGDGGGGQGGAGGLSYCVFEVGASVPALVRCTYNVGTPGTAGVGGKQGVDGVKADDGPAGTSGEIGTP